MTIVRGMELGRELAQTVTQLNKFIDIERKRAEREGVDPSYLRDNNGNLALAQLYVAKAHALHALVLLNQKGMPS